jgi:thiol:disulfide interchange protein
MNIALLDRVSRKIKIFVSHSRVALLVTFAATVFYCGDSPADGDFGTKNKAEIKATSVTWQRFDPDILNHAKQMGRPVVVYFHADWCVPCIELDRDTFSDTQVIDSLKPILRLKVDWTDYDSVSDNLSPEALTLKDQFTVYGIPTIIFIDMNGNEVKASRITGFADSEEFLQKVEGIQPSHLNIER